MQRDAADLSRLHFAVPGARRCATAAWMDVGDLQNGVASVGKNELMAWLVGGLDFAEIKGRSLELNPGGIGRLCGRFGGFLAEQKH